MESPKATTTWVSESARTSSPSSQYQDVVEFAYASPFSEAVRSPVPGKEMYEVVKAAAWKVMAPLVPGAYRLTASASAPRPASSPTGSLNTSAPTGMVTDRRPPNLSSRFVPGTRVEPVFWTPM